MTPETRKELEAIRKRVEAATDGNWSWKINLHAKQVCLEADGSRQIVLDFVRWGTGGAKPRFILDGIMEGAEMFAQVVEGREHHSTWFQTIRHPDADLIANARADELRLLAIIEEQEREIVQTRRAAFSDAIALIPTSWLDSLLTGPGAVLKSKGGTWGCSEIEAVLLGVKQRLEAARDTKSKEDSTK